MPRVRCLLIALACSTAFPAVAAEPPADVLAAIEASLCQAPRADEAAQPAQYVRRETVTREEQQRRVRALLEQRRQALRP